MSARFRTLLIGFRLTTPLSQAPLLGQDELTRRKRDLDTRGLSAFGFTPCLKIIHIQSRIAAKVAWIAAC